MTKVTSKSCLARRMITNESSRENMGTEQATAAKLRILIAEDQALVRRGTAVLLSMEPDMEVVGQACDGIEAVEMAGQLRPDIVLMDLHMPRQGGVAATREITRALPGTQVLVLTTLNDDETVFEAVRAGRQSGREGARGEIGVARTRGISEALRPTSPLGWIVLPGNLIQYCQLQPSMETTRATRHFCLSGSHCNRTRSSSSLHL